MIGYHVLSMSRWVDIAPSGVRRVMTVMSLRSIVTVPEWCVNNLCRPDGVESRLRRVILNLYKVYITCHKYNIDMGSVLGYSHGGSIEDSHARIEGGPGPGSGGANNLLGYSVTWSYIELLLLLQPITLHLTLVPSIDVTTHSPPTCNRIVVWGEWRVLWPYRTATKSHLMVAISRIDG